MILTHIVNNDENEKTVKQVLKYCMGFSERLVKKLKYADKILCNSLPVYVNYVVHEGDKLEALIDFEDTNDDIIPQDIPIDIIYEDDSLIAINKQPNIVVHPTSLHPSGTVANALMFHFIGNDIRTKIRPVSRLDRNTTGVIIFAMNQFVQEHLVRQMSSKTFKKEYLGIVHGIVTPSSGTIDLPIDRKPDSIMIRHISPEGAQSVTHYKVLEYLDNATLISFVLETGRTHQIRVHCQAIGHPLLGDTLYPSLEAASEVCEAEENEEKNDDSENKAETGEADLPISRQALHSSRTEFIHPVTGETIVLTAAMPEDMQRALEILRKH